jgi:hypothetical protein
MERYRKLRSHNHRLGLVDVTPLLAYLDRCQTFREIECFRVLSRNHHPAASVDEPVFVSNSDQKWLVEMVEPDRPFCDFFGRKTPRAHGRRELNAAAHFPPRSRRDVTSLRGFASGHLRVVARAQFQL